MANYRRNGPRGRAKRQAEQRRLRLIVFGGTAAVVLIAVLAALLLPRGGAPDRAAYQPVEGVLQAEGEPLVPQAPAANADSTADNGETKAVPTPMPSPTPEPQGDTVSFASLRAATRPTPTAPGYGLVFSEADTEEKIIAITVDDCFQAENLQKMVDKAIEVGGKFTIFPIGKNVLKKAQSEVLKYAWEHGFELENHTFTHNGLYRCSDEEMAQEIYMQQQSLSHILGVEYQCHFLRPKGGDARRDQRMQVYAEQIGEKGYKLVTLNEMFGYPENETKPLNGAAKDYPVPPLQPYSRVYDVYKPTRYSWGVYLLQEKLIELGYMKGEPDGVYGHDCAKCVKAYQKDHGMEPNGVADVALQEQIFGVPSGA